MAGDPGRCLIHVPYREMDPVRIFTAHLTDEILRYTAKRRELLLQKVPVIRNPKGVVRIRDELYIETRAKESAEDILIRLGFMNVAPVAFPEEIRRMTELEDEPNMDESTLPSLWLDKGLQIALVPVGMEGPRNLALSAALDRPFPAIEAVVSAKRQELGYPSQSFQWSDVDMHIFGQITESNVVFVRQGRDGKIYIEKWYASAIKSKQTYILFWGPQQLIVTHEKRYILQLSELPRDVRNILEESAPEPVTIPLPEPAPEKEKQVETTEA